MAEQATVEQAEKLAQRVLAAIDPWENAPHVGGGREQFAADREQVTSDLAGLRECYCGDGCGALARNAEAHARRYTASLRRIAALYGVAP